MSFFNKCVNVLVATFFALGLSISINTPTVSAVGPDDVCNDLAAANDFVIAESQVLLSHDIGGAVLERNLDTVIPAGQYDITALSYEPQHPNDPIPNQLEEYWSVELFNGADLVYSSPTTIDIPDADKFTLTDFGTGVELTSDVNRIVYTHEGYPEPSQDNLMYHSVIPACVSFNEVSPILSPVCTVEVNFDAEDSAKVSIDITSQDVSGDDVSYVVSWGDGSDEESFTADEAPMHVYAVSGDYTVEVVTYVGADEVARCDNLITVEVEEPAPEQPEVLGIGTSEPNTPAVAVVQTPQTTGRVLAVTGAPGNVSSLVGVILMATVAAVTYFGRRSSAEA